MASSATKTGNIGIPFAASVTTDATTGLATIPFPAKLFTSPPIVTTGAINTAGDGRDIVVTLVGLPTTTGCVVLARKSRTLSSAILSLAALQGFDTFAPVATAVTIMARSAT